MDRACRRAARESRGSPETAARPRLRRSRLISQTTALETVRSDAFPGGLAEPGHRGCAADGGGTSIGTKTVVTTAAHAWASRR